MPVDIAFPSTWIALFTLTVMLAVEEIQLSWLTLAEIVTVPSLVALPLMTLPLTKERPNSANFSFSVSSIVNWISPEAIDTELLTLYSASTENTAPAEIPFFTVVELALAYKAR